MGKCYVDISRNFQFNENTLQIVTIAHNEYKTMVLGIIIICSLVCQPFRELIILSTTVEWCKADVSLEEI